VATSSIEGARLLPAATSSIERLLEGWTVCGGRHAPLAAAAGLLERFGARLDDRCEALRLSAPGAAPVEVRLAGWTGEGALRESLDAALLPNGSPLTAYAALRAAAEAVDGRPVTLRSTQLVRELTAALRFAGPNRPQLMRCRDGWVVARWRDEHEPWLLRALVGPEATRAETVSAAREARLLVGAVRRPALGAGALGSRRTTRALSAGTLEHSPLAGGRRLGRRPRVVDWTVLWAGPWAAQEVRRSGADVERIEHPRRRDGLLAWPDGQAWWRRLNGGKRLSLLDGRRDGDRARLERSLADADVLLTSMTPRALRTLGFGDDWRAEHAPHLLHVELVAFEPPWGDAPGLGEHAAAEAGLLWNGDDRPCAPYPWADPLLGALALLTARAWLASGHARGGRVRLSLERAASLAFAA
jgi:CoA-transferase family III